MSEREHTTVKLARALKAIPGVPPEMIARARDGYYHDYLSPVDQPEVQLVTDLRELADRPATPRTSRNLPSGEPYTIKPWADGSSPRKVTEGRLGADVR